jgi:NAD-dependent deacetylase
MTRTIIPEEDLKHLDEAVDAFLSARHPAAFTGAGISVESGIPDFRSPDGLWTIFSPEEYATIDAFLEDPEKAWKLYRAIGEALNGTKPNPAHCALARLEKSGHLSGLVTQNVDGLHQAAGSENVIEIHGDHQHLQCLECGKLEKVERAHYTSEQVPRCGACGYALKPNVVLFGEGIRHMDEITALLEACDLLLVIGTSAQVYPAAGIPGLVKEKGGLIYEFNLEATDLTRGEVGSGFLARFLFPGAGGTGTDFFFKGEAGETLSLLAEHVIK